VGELHSLTDWQVSEASEEAELVDFCRARRIRKATRVGKGITSGVGKRLREQERCELPSVQYKKKPAPIPRDKKDAGGKGQEDDGAACGPQKRRPIPAYSDSTTLLGAKEVSHDSSDLSVYRYVYIL
jgi:hypothetical protein